MSYVWLHNEDYNSINNAIKEKLSVATDYDINQMAAAIDTIDSGTLSPLTLTNFLNKNVGTELIIPSSSIRKRAFFELTTLVSITLTNATTIGIRSFMGDTALKTVILNKTTYIGDYAFNLCRSLESLTIKTNEVCSLGVSPFYSSSIEFGTCNIYVPANLVNAYKASSNWINYANQIFAIPSE